MKKQLKQVSLYAWILAVLSKYGIIVSMIFVGTSFMILSADGESNVIPDWIKNTAKWWSEDQINETEYIATLQYLIDQDIIKVNSPISSVFATNVTIPNEQRAQSFEVNVRSDQYDMDETYYTSSNLLTEMKPQDNLMACYLVYLKIQNFF